MFLGHFAAGMAAKAATPRVSLGMLFLAAQFVDLLWPTLLLAGIEEVRIDESATAFTPLDFVSYPISHSLVMSVVWGVVVGGLFWLVRKNVRGAVVLAVLVLSHWVLDFIVHRPDLPITPGESMLVGLGLWNQVAWTIVLEGLLFAAGIFVYLRVTKARDKAGRYGFWGLVAFLGLIYVGSAMGPPPPDATAIAWVGQAQWLLVLAAFWVDRHRIDSRERVVFAR